VKSSKVSKILRGVGSVVFITCSLLGGFGLIAAEVWVGGLGLFTVFSVIAIEYDLYDEETSQ
jgi:hypothetical protein